MRVILGLLSVCLLVSPALASAQSFQVQASAGPTLYDVGHSVAAGVGLVATKQLAVVVEFERTHNPSQITRRDGVTSASRRGTLTAGTAQVHVALRGWDRVGPYGLAGMVVGVSRPNVNEIFPDRVTHNVRGISIGGGIHLPVGERISLFADVRFSVTCCALHGVAPVRTGMAWSF
jgi:opacity protein-like surface antigen